MEKPLFPSLTCSVCGGSMTKVSEKDGEAEYVCMNDETHKRRVKRAKPRKVKTLSEAR
jgi:hypothetical protein